VLEALCLRWRGLSADEKGSGKLHEVEGLIKAVSWREQGGAFFTIARCRGGRKGRPRGRQLEVTSVVCSLSRFAERGSG